MNRTLTCIVCPLGCELSVELEEGLVRSVSGNACPRGKAYAESECTNPTRTLTTTVCTENGGRVSVKTDRPIPKARLFDAMATLDRLVVATPISVGDVLVEDLFGARVVATQNKN